MPAEKENQMGLHPDCPLCQTSSSALIPEYYLCPQCDLRFLDQRHHLPPQQELERYHLHTNRLDDQGYRDFLLPLAQAVYERMPAGSRGLDFGCGPGPLLAKILEEMKFKIQIFDPYFFNQPEVLLTTYDFITASEVIEHFYNPRQEFEFFVRHLRPNGLLAVMTAIYDPSIDFQSWYYRKDPTHVVFYSRQTLNWIAKEFGFQVPEISGSRLALFGR